MPNITYEDLKADFKTALKIINSDIGMKNSILAQCDTENPETKESIDSMRKSIADGERLLTKYADFQFESMEVPHNSPSAIKVISDLCGIPEEKFKTILREQMLLEDAILQNAGNMLHTLIRVQNAIYRATSGNLCISPNVPVDKIIEECLSKVIGDDTATGNREELS